MNCSSCSPAQPDDIEKEKIKQAAIDQSKENKEPVAIYKEAGEFKKINAFQAYKLGYAVIEVVSPYNGPAT
ncbi:MAG TPA: hypothetical protein VMZ03_03875 [Chitinophagaceae bacterium]|nr:hypothetical protein [Chitinophagaceae bacterium]